MTDGLPTPPECSLWDEKLQKLVWGEVVATKRVELRRKEEKICFLSAVRPFEFLNVCLRGKQIFIYAADKLGKD